MATHSRSRRRLSVPAPQIIAEPDISEAHKRVVERALRWAWAEVTRRWPSIVRNEREEVVTEKMQRVLNEHSAGHKRSAPGLRLFETVDRGSKVTGADGHIELMPDLVFRPLPVPHGVRNRCDWGYFVECKIVDGTSSVGLYCKNGLERFISGKYSARMPSAAMLAYVRDGSRPFQTLEPRLAGAYSTLSHNERGSDVSESLHGRGTLRCPCIDIAIVHVWLQS